MKKMKRIMCVVLAALTVFAMTACGGGKEQTAVLTLEQNGVTMEYKMDAKGDSIQKITQTSTIDCTGYSAEDIAMVEASIAEYAAIYEAYEGVTYKTESTDTTFNEIIELDVSDDELVQSLSEAGLLPIEGDGSNLSLEKTIENLTAQGWVEQTAE